MRHCEGIKGRWETNQVSTTSSLKKHAERGDENGNEDLRKGKLSEVRKI